jgi:hypothetical protein
MRQCPKDPKFGKHAENPNKNPQKYFFFFKCQKTRWKSSNIFAIVRCWSLSLTDTILISALINWKQQIATNHSISCSRRHKKNKQNKMTRARNPDKT